MTGLPDHHAAFERGIVTESGFGALCDAEVYGAAASIGAGSACLHMLWQALELHTLLLYTPGGESISVVSHATLAQWCQAYFPDCFSEYLARASRA
ncbi:hypothetical protein [Vreelandella sp. EE22]